MSLIDYQATAKLLEQFSNANCQIMSNLRELLLVLQCK